MSSSSERRAIRDEYEARAERDDIKYFSGCYHHVKRRDIMLKVVRSLTVNYDSTVLDVGCGDGWYTYPLSKFFNNVVGIDISTKRLKRASRYAKKASFVLCDGNSLPFKEKIFHLIVAAQYLEHVEDPKATIRRLTSHIKEKGLLVLEVPSKSNMVDRLIIGLQGNPTWGLTMEPTHRHFFDESCLTKIFNALDLEIVEVTGVVHLRYLLPLVGKMVWDSKRTFWELLNVIDELLGTVKSRWGAIQLFVVRSRGEAVR